MSEEEPVIVSPADDSENADPAPPPLDDAVQSEESSVESPERLRTEASAALTDNPFAEDASEGEAPPGSPEGSEVAAAEDATPEDAEGLQDDFFVSISSIREKYEKSARQTVRLFQFPTADVPEVEAVELPEQLWPTLGGWNVDDLYTEVIYALLHSLKGKQHEESEAVISYLQQVFHVDNDKHTKILEAARDKQAPSLVLNLEVIEARGLKGKDVNGLSDPFCTIYVSPRLKHNTSMKPGTLNPSWREYFSMPITSLEDEVLTIEVWDYDPVETVGEKMRRFNEVKSTRGLRILCKEIALTASTGKHKHEFLGCLKIPVKDIPADGFDTWFNLEGKNGNSNKKKGEIHLRMGMGAERDKKAAAQEYRHVLHLLLVHELDEENIPHAWNGSFSKHSDYILRQLRWQGGLQPCDIDLAKWLVYTRVQCEHALNANLFPPLFLALIDHMEKDVFREDEIRKIWFAAEKLVDNFTGFLKGIHQGFLSNSNVAAQAFHMLQTLGSIRKYLQTHEVNKELRCELTPDLIVQKAENALSRGAEDMFNGIMKCDGSENETEVEIMIRLGQLLIADLRMGRDIVNRQFNEHLDLDYFDITYKLYDDLYSEEVHPVVEKISQNIRPLNLGDDGTLSQQEQDVSVGTSLFELYLALKQFADLSSELKSTKELNIQGKYHQWFYSSVAHWLDIARYKADQRIQKAVQLDTLRPIDNFVKRSSSAVDTPHIFHQIQIFWDQLAWPEVEGSYTFIARILDDMCRCIITYADSMYLRVEQLEMNKTRNRNYEVSQELCLAINNIEYVVTTMKVISEKLETEKMLKEMEKINGSAVAEQCRRTLNTVMENAVENVNNKIYIIFDGVGQKMGPVILRFLLEGAETTNDIESLEKLMTYLDKNLIQLKQKMTASAFSKGFAVMWERVGASLRELIYSNVEKRRPPAFFQQVHEMLEVLINFFYPNGVDESIIQDTDIQFVRETIALHGASTVDLMIRYFQDRYKDQSSNRTGDSKPAMITLRVTYTEDTQLLKVEIMNCRNLKSMDKNGSSDPYVKIQIAPKELFGVPPQKTKLKKKTLFPLFDETFMFPLTTDAMSQGGFIHFTVKDHDTFGTNEMLGEAFLPIESIPFTGSLSKLQDLPQVHLPLTFPMENLSSAVLIQTLENRHWDKTAVDFAKKERLKAGGVVSP